MLKGYKKKYAIRKLSVAAASVFIGLGFAVGTEVSAQTLKVGVEKEINYKYVLESELTSQEKSLIVKELPSNKVSEYETYYMVYKEGGPSVLPKTKAVSKGNLNYIAAALGTGLILLALKYSKKRRKFIVSSIILLTATGSYNVSAIENVKLAGNDKVFTLQTGQELPETKINIENHNFVGYILIDNKEDIMEPCPSPEANITKSGNLQTAVNNVQESIPTYSGVNEAIVSKNVGVTSEAEVATEAVRTKIVTELPVTKIVTEAPVSRVVTDLPVTRIITEPPVSQVVSNSESTQILVQEPVTKIVTEAPVTKIVTEAPATRIVTEAPVTKIIEEATTQLVGKVPALVVEGKPELILPTTVMTTKSLTTVTSPTIPVVTEVSTVATTVSTTKAPETTAATTVSTMKASETTVATTQTTVATTKAPETTAATTVSTTKAPETTTATTVSTTNTPETTVATTVSTTKAPETTVATTQTTVATTKAPETTVATTVSTTKAPETTAATTVSTTNAPETTTATPVVKKLYKITYVELDANNIPKLHFEYSEELPEITDKSPLTKDSLVLSSLYDFVEIPNPDKTPMVRDGDNHYFVYVKKKPTLDFDQTLTELKQLSPEVRQQLANTTTNTAIPKLSQELTQDQLNTLKTTLIDEKKFNEAMLKLVNEERQKAGLQPIALHEELKAGADLRASEQAATGYFRSGADTNGDGISDGKHIRPDGSSWATAFTYLKQVSRRGENMGQFATDDLRELVSEEYLAKKQFELFKSSPDHYANIMDPGHDVGYFSFGLSDDHKILVANKNRPEHTSAEQENGQGVIFTQVFGRKRTIPLQ